MSAWSCSQHNTEPPRAQPIASAAETPKARAGIAQMNCKSKISRVPRHDLASVISTGKTTSGTYTLDLHFYVWHARWKAVNTWDVLQCEKACKSNHHSIQTLHSLHRQTPRHKLGKYRLPELPRINGPDIMLTRNSIPQQPLLLQRNKEQEPRKHHSIRWVRTWNSSSTSPRGNKWLGGEQRLKYGKNCRKLWWIIQWKSSDKETKHVAHIPRTRGVPYTRWVSTVHTRYSRVPLDGFVAFVTWSSNKQIWRKIKWKSPSFYPGRLVFSNFDVSIWIVNWHELGQSACDPLRTLNKETDASSVILSNDCIFFFFINNSCSLSVRRNLRLEQTWCAFYSKQVFTWIDRAQHHEWEIVMIETTKASTIYERSYYVGCDVMNIKQQLNISPLYILPSHHCLHAIFAWKCAILLVFTHAHQIICWKDKA